ncbi:MAG: hypothetical protein ACK4UJ_03745 [Leptonema sp. (in: bacteria)]
MNLIKQALFVIVFLHSPIGFYRYKLHSQIISDSSKSQINITLQEKESLTKGEENFFKKNFSVSEIFFKKVVEINPENAYAHSYLGEIYLYFKKFENAIYHLQIAIELLSNQKNFFPEKEYFRLSQTYYLKKESQKSKEYCEVILKKNQDFFPCYYYLGMIALEFDKNRDLALENLKKFLHILESEKSVNITYYETEKEKVKQVIKLLSNPANTFEDSNLKKELDPLSIFYKNSNPQNLSLLNPNQQKERNLEFTLPTEKMFDEKWIEIQYLKNTNKKKAIEILNEYKNSKEMKSAKENFLIRKSLCYFFLEEKNYEDAEKECKDALSFDYDREILYYLAILYYKNQKYDLFESFLKKYLEQEKYDINSYFMLAHYHYEQKNYPQALSYFEKILSIQSNHKESLFYVFKIYSELDKPRMIKETIEKIELYFPEDYDLLRYLTFTLLEKKEEEFALELLKKIYKNTKDKMDGLTLAGFYLKLNQKEKVREILYELYPLYSEDFDVIKSLILFFKEEQTNFDTMELIAKRYLSIANSEQKSEILRILPDSVKEKILGSIPN